RVSAIVIVHFEIFGWIPDRPAVVAVVSLVPPAVQDTDIENTIHRSLLAAGATSLKRRTRIVEPHIDALSKEMRGVHFVIFAERDMACHTVIGGKRIDLVNQMFAVLIRRMGFT